MPVLIYLMLGAAAGYLGARAMGFRSDPVTVLALGGLGALAAVMGLRLAAGVAQTGATAAAAVGGALAVLWLWRVLVERR
ncbi:GlsB/YeaQ/YmgE family stress response membrane protein [Rhodobaculum claviforme]|uniref:GlsB/YeaQ/YmgE family stress response membrane protein n=1 Tax=Rhodobaculum claviforme TaxID=1549854 RepID=A0A934TPL3_9RHOB|nr:GlsB/YeaQ/YmgE family stress response membrane protein [Rhodobaculum claviforme]MBK5928848.1 hypothetical protein [Rhodobaculum claviforme]